MPVAASNRFRHSNPSQFGTLSAGPAPKAIHRITVPCTIQMHSDCIFEPPIMNIESIKARQKATWETGDFGQLARLSMPAAEEFMARVDVRPGMRVLDAACGTGNLAVIAARRGAHVAGLDIASNLIAQARERAQAERLAIEFTEGDVEAMPYTDAQFDLVFSMHGVMFAPRPDRVLGELHRVLRPGGGMALASWTPTGFIGKTYDVFARYLPPNGLPSPLLWGDEPTLRARVQHGFNNLRFEKRLAQLQFPFNPAATVSFLRRYYGPTQAAFNSLAPTAQDALMRDLVELQSQGNVSRRPDETITPSEYLELQCTRRPISTDRTAGFNLP